MEFLQEVLKLQIALRRFAESVMFVLVLLPEMSEFNQSVLGGFLQNYYRVVQHYEYDPLWQPGYCFSLGQIGEYAHAAF